MRGVIDMDRTAFAFTPDGARLATGHEDGRVQLWDTTTGKLLEVLHGHHRAITSVAITATGAHLLAQSDDSTASLWTIPLERRTPRELRQLTSGVSWILDGGVLVPRR